MQGKGGPNQPGGQFARKPHPNPQFHSTFRRQAISATGLVTAKHALAMEQKCFFASRGAQSFHEHCFQRIPPPLSRLCACPPPPPQSLDIPWSLKLKYLSAGAAMFLLAHKLVVRLKFGAWLPSPPAGRRMPGQSLYGTQTYPYMADMFFLKAKHFIIKGFFWHFPKGSPKGHPGVEQSSKSKKVESPIFFKKGLVDN